MEDNRSERANGLEDAGQRATPHARQCCGVDRSYLFVESDQTHERLELILTGLSWSWPANIKGALAPTSTTQ